MDNLHAGRYFLQDIYRTNVESILHENEKLSVAVIGADRNEVEYIYLLKKKAISKSEFFGISTEENYLDLNEITIEDYSSSKKVFDLVICCQVLEHVWNLNTAIQNLASLVRVGGYIWINTPASNLKHGSPNYFSAGYQSELFERLFESHGFKSLSRGEIGTKRLYCMTHEQQYWPSHKILVNPFLRGIESRPYLFPLKFLRFFVRNFRAILWSNKLEHSSQWATETYFFAVKS